MKQLVSILIPVFNGERWISDCIESALAQTWRWKEIIVVDDGSSDSTLEIARSYASRNVKVTNQERRGASAARNHALLLAQGDYIQWLDADDLLAPDKIEQQMKMTYDPKNTWKTLYSSSFGRFYFRYQSAKFIKNSLWQDLLPLDWMLIKFRESVYMSLDAWLVSRKLTEIAGPWDERLVRDNDGDYSCHLVLASDKVIFVPEAKSYYRAGNFGSLSTGRTREVYESFFLSQSACIERLRTLEDSDRTKMASLMLLQKWFIFFYPEYPHIIEKAVTLAKELGGELQLPVLKWKYAWLRKIFGWKAAKLAQHLMPMSKVIIRRNWDKLLYKLSI
jgi:glycosyltransferase involved in cell wall biosynthesis